jgi:uncharacterized protein DUF6527
MRKVDIDLGLHHTLSWTEWTHEERHGAIIAHTLSNGSMCEGAITFDTPAAREAFPQSHFWQVVTWEPLTLTPSIRCHCGDHGFIQQGKWVPA